MFVLYVAKHRDYELRNAVDEAIISVGGSALEKGQLLLPTTFIAFLIMTAPTFFF